MPCTPATKSYKTSRRARRDSKNIADDFNLVDDQTRQLHRFLTGSHKIEIPFETKKLINRISPNTFTPNTVKLPFFGSLSHLRAKPSGEGCYKHDHQWLGPHYVCIPLGSCPDYLHRPQSFFDNNHPTHTGEQWWT